MREHQHLGADIVEQYVMGALDAQSARFVDGVVAACPSCARLLRQEAALEVALYQVMKGREVGGLFGRPRRVRALVAGAAAALALGVVVLSSGDGDPPARAQPTVRACVDAATASQCIFEGQFDGVITIGPNLEPIIPRYDVTPGATP